MQLGIGVGASLCLHLVVAILVEYIGSDRVGNFKNLNGSAHSYQNLSIDFRPTRSNIELSDGASMSATDAQSATNKEHVQESQHGSLNPDGFINIALPHYFSPDELTKKPQVIGSVNLNFPDMFNDKVAGKVSLRILINESGEIDKVLTDTSGLSSEFETAALAAFKKTKFKPGEKDGIIVKSQIKIEVDFFAH